MSALSPVTDTNTGGVPRSIATDFPQSKICERDTEGIVVSAGEYSSCMFTDECIEAGEQTRTNSVCRDGIAVNVPEVQACERDTDSIVVQPEFDECTYTDACIETGEQVRTNSVCRNGTAVDEADVQVCVRDTDGTVLEHGEFEACRGFEDLCDRRRTI